MPSIFQQQSNYAQGVNRIFLFARTSPTNNLGGVVPIPVPSGAGVLGGSEVIGTSLQHVKIVVPSGPIDVQFPHGLTRGGSIGTPDGTRYAPTAVWCIQELAEASTPSAVYAVVWSKTNPGVITIAFSAAGTWHVYYA